MVYKRFNPLNNYLRTPPTNSAARCPNGMAWNWLGTWNVFHHPPVHCSWLNQVEQWFSILQRKRLAIADFADKAELAGRLHAYIKEWNAVAQPFQWSTKSVTKIMAKCGQPLPNDTPVAQAA